MQKSGLSNSVSGKPLQDVSNNNLQHLKSSRKQQSQSSVPQSTSRRNASLHSRKQTEPETAVQTPDSASTGRRKDVGNSPVSQLRIRKNRDNRRPPASRVSNPSRESSVAQKRGAKENEGKSNIQIEDELPCDFDIFAAGAAIPASEGSMIPTALVADRRPSVEKREPQGNPAAKRRVFSKVMGTLQGMTRTPVTGRDIGSTGSLIRRLSGKGSRNAVNASAFDVNAFHDVTFAAGSVSSETIENLEGQEESTETNSKSPGSLQVSTPSPPSTVRPVRAISHFRRSRRPEDLQDIASVNISLTLEKNTVDFSKEETFWVLVEAEVRHNPLDSLSSNTMSDLIMYIDVCSGCEIICLLGPHYRHSLIVGDVYSRYALVKVPALQRPEKPAPLDSANDDLLFDHVLADLEGMLGVFCTDMFTINLRYKHPLFSDDTHIVVEKTCSVQRTPTTSVWDLRDNQRNSNDGIHEGTLAASQLRLGKTDALAMIKDFEECACPAELPPPLAKVKDEYDQRKPTTDKARVSRQGGASHHLPRFSFESNISMPECLEECPLNIPKRTTSYSPSTMTNHTSRSTPDERNDKARHIWHIMRQDSKGRRAGLARNSSESLLRLESTDESLRAIRQKALRNKRSVGADTLRSFAVGARDGMDAPWL